MTTTITVGSDTYTPRMLLGYKSTRKSRNVLSAISGTSGYAVSLRTATLRSGTLEALFDTETTARDLETALSGAVVATISDTDVSTVAMSFVIDGNLDLELEDNTRLVWIVRFSFQEVEP